MASRLDPVTLEVIRNAFPAIANEMAADLQRTSYNMMIYEVGDFCTAVVDTDGRLLSQNTGGVSHFVADLGIIVEDAIAQHGCDGFKPGDVLITNHQKIAGQHLNNVVIHMPYFFEGELVCFSIVRAHWIDIGGVSTGFGGGPTVADPWIEGLQLDQLKIYEAGELNTVLNKLISDNIRFPEASLGDMRSQIAACRLATRRLDELYGRYGADTVAVGIERVFDETEQKCRNVVETIPDGVYESETFLDNDGVDQDDPVRIHAEVTVEGSSMTIDLSGCSGERRSAINSRTLAGARVAYKCLTAPLEAVNEGSFRAVDVIIPEGNIMMARYPAPMASWSTPIPTVVDTILSALAPAAPDRIPAPHHGVLGGGDVVFFGRRPDTGRPFVVQSIEGAGWGGRPHEDGESATVSVCQGDVRNGPIESIEIKCPVIVEQRALRPGSAGAGKYRGGVGIEVEVRNLVEGRWNMRRSPRTNHPPQGLWGGGTPATTSYHLRRPGENDYTEMNVHRYLVPADSSVIVRSGGGPGWGDPLERDPEMVRRDVSEELIDAECARRDYGVVLEGSDLAVNTTATEALRAKMSKARGPIPKPSKPQTSRLSSSAAAPAVSDGHAAVAAAAHNPER